MIFGKAAAAFGRKMSACQLYEVNIVRLYSISVYVTRYVIYHDDHDYRNEVRTMQRN